MYPHANKGTWKTIVESNRKWDRKGTYRIEILLLCLLAKFFCTMLKQTNAERERDSSAGHL